jgi:hypothetical protein
VTFQLADQSVELPASHLLALDRGLRHAVEAAEESSFLLTVSWPKGVEQG